MLHHRYIRHQNSLGYTEVVDANSSALLKQDATWRIVPGLADATCYSFESRNYPGQYLRHQAFRVRKDANDNSALFKADATWCAQQGTGGVRLTAWNFPGQFLRHRASELWLATPGGPNAWDNAHELHRGHHVVRGEPLGPVKGGSKRGCRPGAPCFCFFSGFRCSLSGVRVHARMTVAIGIRAARMAGIRPPSTPATRPAITPATPACHGKVMSCSWVPREPSIPAADVERRPRPARSRPPR